MFNMFKKNANTNEAIVMTNGDIFDLFLFPTMREQQYHLVTENFHNMGYNHYLLYVDSDKNLLHIYDEISSTTGGTSAINRINDYLIEKVYEALNLGNPKKAKALIYFPEMNSTGVGIVTYGYHADREEYDFGHDISESNRHEPFIKLAQNHK
ncbi:hypothetical protein COO03_05095 [Bacillus sp. AFS098217]|uniref:hypothetical protein n=1 Tax=Bacillus sp. AFS098217 TaxID=2033868 RepID=UPI000BEBD942|nr:hypothetical protein [Bacillus sp. AFS098217]PEB54619.1 hypothetical protein COO03_05095 [Bacillus sp. AFS098217]